MIGCVPLSEGFVRFRLRWISAILFAGLATTASAAVIDVRKLKDGTGLIFIEGDIVLGDEKTFANVALGHENAIVVLSSDGGNLHAGIEIGKSIRLKGFSTFVTDGQGCASACALAWLGGRSRAMSASARVGFHAAHTLQGEQKITTSVGNALVGAYVAQLGLPERAVIYVTSAAPDEIRWLTFADAQRVGIEVKQINLNEGTTAPRSQPPPVAQGTATGSWGRYGDWIQIYSRPVQLEATQIATAIKAHFDNTYVFRFANGWYGVVIGPFPAGTGVARRDALVAAGAIPADSLIPRPDRMVDLVFGSTPALPGGAPAADGSASAEVRARGFMAELQRRWSLDNAQALATLDAVYADTIQYYGRPNTKQAVMTEKRQFAERWPARSYAVRADTLTASCSADGRDCRVEAIVDWRAASAARGATSIGSARLELQLRQEGSRMLVVGETGTVLNRSTARN